MYSTWWGKTIGFGISPFSTWEGKRHNHEIKVKYQERPGRRRSMKKARSCVQYTIQKKKERSSREVLVWKDTGTWWLASLICKSFLLDWNKFRTVSRNPVRCRIFFFFSFFFVQHDGGHLVWSLWQMKEWRNQKWEMEKKRITFINEPNFGFCLFCFLFGPSSLGRSAINSVLLPWYRTATCTPRLYFYVLLLHVLVSVPTNEVPLSQ